MKTQSQTNRQPPTRRVVNRRARAAAQPKRAMLTSRAVLERYGSISDRTLDRWLADERLGFPRPLMIRKRRFWDPALLDQFDAKQAGA